MFSTRGRLGSSKLAERLADTRLGFGERLTLVSVKTDLLAWQGQSARYKDP